MRPRLVNSHGKSSHGKSETLLRGRIVGLLCEHATCPNLRKKGAASDWFQIIDDCPLKECFRGHPHSPLELIKSRGR